MKTNILLLQIIHLHTSSFLMIHQKMSFSLHSRHPLQNLIPMYLHHQLQIQCIYLTIMPHLNLVPLPLDKSFSPIPIRFQSPLHPSSSRSNTLRNNTSVAPRRFSRESKLPSHLNDYICNYIFLTDHTTSCFAQPTTHTAYFFWTSIPPNQLVLQSISEVSEPTSFSQASMHPGWQKARDSEIEALQKNHTWEMILLPPENKALPCK